MLGHRGQTDLRSAQVLGVDLDAVRVLHAFWTALAPLLRSRIRNPEPQTPKTPNPITRSTLNPTPLTQTPKTPNFHNPYPNP